MAVPVSMLRARGVHTVYYQLEPLGSYGPNPMTLAERGCEVNALNRRAGEA